MYGSLCIGHEKDADELSLSFKSGQQPSIRQKALLVRNQEKSVTERVPEKNSRKRGTQKRDAKKGYLPPDKGRQIPGNVYALIPEAGAEEGFGRLSGTGFFRYG